MFSVRWGYSACRLEHRCSLFFMFLLLTKTFSQRRQWHPTPALLPGKSHGWRSLVGYSPWGLEESDMTEWLHFHALEKEMATHSSVLAWRIPGMGEPGGLPSMGSHRVGHNWSDLAAAAREQIICTGCFVSWLLTLWLPHFKTSYPLPPQIAAERSLKNIPNHIILLCMALHLTQGKKKTEQKNSP